MIERYTREDMKNVWSEQNKFRMFYRVEMAVINAMRRLCKIPYNKFAQIRDHMDFSIDRIHELEKTTHHDVIAFVQSLCESVDKNLHQYIHKGMTSSDVVDTALALQMGQAGRIILKNLDALIEILEHKAVEHKDTICVGRTHGIHAEPITFGFKILNWLDSVQRVRDNFELSLSQTQVGKISGAVGTYSNIDPKIEQYTCELLGLKPAKITTQVIARDIHAQFVQSLALIACVIERIATELRHLQRTEVDEVKEGFSQGQKGSSAMPHKKNPVSSENLCGLARIVRSNSIAALENVALWHERDISHSSVERIILPDSAILVDYMLDRLCGIIENMEVDVDHMHNNLWITRGAIFSSKLFVTLCEKGIPKNEAYEFVQRYCFDVISNANFDVISDDLLTINKYLSREEIDQCVNPLNFLKHVGLIYDRFGLKGENNE